MIKPKNEQKENEKGKGKGGKNNNDNQNQNHHRRTIFVNDDLTFEDVISKVVNIYRANCFMHTLLDKLHLQVLLEKANARDTLSQASDDDDDDDEEDDR